MSLRKHLINLHLRLFEKPHLARCKDPSKLRASFDTKAKWLFHPPRGSRFENSALNHGGADVPALWVRARNTREGPVILYLHGGGYVYGSPKSYSAMLAQLSAKTGLPACLPDYRLAPEHAFPAAFEDALTGYMALSDHPGGVVIGGDSAGGGLALALLAKIIALGLPKPKGTFAFSPLTDMTFSSDSFADNARSDVVLPAQGAGEMVAMYLRDADPRDPRASPLFADFTGAPPVWLAVGDTEILLDDSRNIATVMHNQGVEVTLLEARNLSHVWPLFHGYLPESRQTLDTLAQWIKALSPPTGGN
ncbi:6-hexanolactone hydrolase [hydrothermal vent metagenome]|uniref:6-hexanolactone hydrolase n=1 Tax=hydrothermal vent metagenome TaxID=652676 RepID=A0A3B0TEB2_9ZZZZ